MKNVKFFHRFITQASLATDELKPYMTNITLRRLITTVNLHTTVIWLIIGTPTIWDSLSQHRHSHINPR